MPNIADMQNRTLEKLIWKKLQWLNWNLENSAYVTPNLNLPPLLFSDQLFNGYIQHLYLLAKFLCGYEFYTYVPKIFDPSPLRSDQVLLQTDLESGSGWYIKNILNFHPVIKFWPGWFLGNQLTQIRFTKALNIQLSGRPYISCSVHLQLCLVTQKFTLRRMSSATIILNNSVTLKEKKIPKKQYKSIKW